MDQRIEVCQAGLFAVFEIGAGTPVYLLHYGAVPFRENDILPYQKEKFRLVQLQAAGYDHTEHHGSKHTGTMPGMSLRFTHYEDEVNEYGRKLVFYQQTEGLCVISHVQFYSGLPAARFWNVVENRGEKEVILEYLSSFALCGCAKEGLCPWDEKIKLHIPDNTWAGEVQWRQKRLTELGLIRVEGTAAVSDPQSMQNFSLKRICMTGSGTWGCSEYLPMGCLENEESGGFITWQTEHHSAWHCEVSDNMGQIYIQLSGPTGNEHQWYKRLSPGQAFTSVKAAVAAGSSLEETIGALTCYRRKIRRKNRDNAELPIIFNDYMNCLYGDPTTEKLIPLIDAAQQAGCEYFCIDAGWYADGEWWDGVGEWSPSPKRFPGGIEIPLQHIRNKGMIPGLWLELEVMGVNCPLAKKLPDDWFFTRYGKRVTDHGRFQLDYRNPDVRNYADSVIKRLTEEYGIGYIKMDYNINAGTGTDWKSDSPGDGLLEHCQAYLDWLRTVIAKCPELVIENCSSGGMRMAYSLLSLLSIQSVSDQIDYKKMAVIAAAAPSAVTPEQAAVWAYPTESGDEEETIFNMVNALLSRIHLSGHLAKLSQNRFSLVKEALCLYKKIRAEIKEGTPFWPIGMPVFGDEWAAYGLYIPRQNKAYLAVWHLEEGLGSHSFPIRKQQGIPLEVSCIYPKGFDCGWYWNITKGNLSIRLPEKVCARLFCLQWT